MKDTRWEHHPVTVYRPAFWSAMPANSMPNRGGRPTILQMSLPATAPVTYSKNMDDRLPPGMAISVGDTFTYSSDHAMLTPTIAAATLAAVAGIQASHHAMAATSPPSSNRRCSLSPPSRGCSCCSGSSSGGSANSALSCIFIVSVRYNVCLINWLLHCTDRLIFIQIQLDMFNKSFFFYLARYRYIVFFITPDPILTSCVNANSLVDS